MDITNEVINMIATPENKRVEYKSVLPPSKVIAKLIGSFANTDGGYIILGVSDDFKINGLSEDFYANSITRKALELLSPQPQIYYQYVSYRQKKLYVIKIEQSDQVISLEEKVYKREDNQIVLVNPIEVNFKNNGYEKIKSIDQQLKSYGKKATAAKLKLIEHYQSVLKIFDDLGNFLYPQSPDIPTENQEGKVLCRILFSSLIDTFETYLSDLLFEICLAMPKTLKSGKQVTTEEVLNCSDLPEFIKYLAKQQISKFQKGSVRGFLKENKQIRNLDAIDDKDQNEIEKIFQIRHLYSHRNGIVDEKFLEHYVGEFELGAEHQMAISEICNRLCYLAKSADTIDLAAIDKYRLAQSNL